MPTRVPYAYYQRLSAKQKEIYRVSDRISAIRLERPAVIGELVEQLGRALAADDRAAVQAAATALCGSLTQALSAPPVPVQVLAVRPQADGSELHGLYTYESDESCVIKVWMRTAKHQRVVAFRTFVRTLLHELCHHLDFTVFKLRHSFHTEGFFKRESSLFHQLVPAARRTPS